LEACEKGTLIGHPITGVRYVLEDGAAHAVDSNELAFRLAGLYALRDAYAAAGPQILEPVMSVTVTAPAEYQGIIVAALNKRKGVIHAMFGFSTDLRSATQVIELSLAQLPI
jgi:elongation factor G